jgi:SAM-dependent methyltransferase
MQHIDYTKNRYHQIRHPEFINNKLLQFAWSECAKKFYFNGLKERKTIFEFGGAFGYNLFALKEKHNCNMLELSEIGRANAKKFGIETYKTLFEVKRKKFDIVLCRHVLEHIAKPLETLITLKKMLKSDGYLVLVLPLEGTFDKPVANDIDFHLFSWNPRTICNLLKYVGFSTLSYKYQYFNGRRICLPIYKIFGPKAYVFSVQFLGWVTRSKELVIVCQ